MNYDNSEPIYIQLCKSIKAEIISGKLVSGEKIQSVRNLALLHNVNPNTIVKTLAILENEGFIYTDSTNGKYVTKDLEFLNNYKKEFLNDKVNKFIDEMKTLGYKKEEILSIVEKRG